MKTVFVKYNNYRNKEFNIITQIVESDGSKFVIKRAQNNDAIPHIERINNSVELFRKNIISNKNVILDIEKIDSKTLKTPYVEGRTYETLLLDCLQHNDIGGFKKLILDYKQWLISAFVTKDNDRFIVRDEHGFGCKIDSPIKNKYFNFAPLDLIFSNLIVNENGINVIDQEWTYTFSTPLSYVLYRSIFYFYINNHLAIGSKAELYDILSEVGITKDITEQYQEIELNFQNMVRGNYFKDRAKYKKPDHIINEGFLSKAKDTEQVAELFVKDELVCGHYKKRNNRYEYSWKDVFLGGVIKIRLATPFSCFVIRSIRLKDYSNINRSISDFKTNRDAVVDIFDYKKAYYNGKEIPLIEFELKRSINVKELIVDLEILSQGEQESQRLLNFSGLYHNMRNTRCFKYYNKLKSYYYKTKALTTREPLKEFIICFIERIEAFSIGRFKFNRTIKSVYDGRPRKHNKICLFASYDPDSQIKEYVKYYLTKLSLLDYDLVFITSSKSITGEDLKFLLDKCVKVVHKTNIGYDFGSWAAGYRILRNDIKKSEQLLLANDSVFGPINDLKNMMDYMNDQNLDTWGCTDSYEHNYHLQSYFINFNNKVIHSNFLDKFFGKYTIFNKKADIIKKYEIGLSNNLLKEGYKIGAYCGYNNVTSYIYWNELDCTFYIYSTLCVNSTHYFWNVLINEFQCPFIKKELLLKNPVNIEFSNGHYRNDITIKTDYNFDLMVNTAYGVK